MLEAFSKRKRSQSLVSAWEELQLLQEGCPSSQLYAVPVQRYQFLIFSMKYRPFAWRLELTSSTAIQPVIVCWLHTAALCSTDHARLQVSVSWPPWVAEQCSSPAVYVRQSWRTNLWHWTWNTEQSHERKLKIRRLKIMKLSDTKFRGHFSTTIPVTIPRIDHMKLPFSPRIIGVLTLTHTF